MSRMTIDELLARARGRLDRVTVGEAVDAVRDGAAVVDIRSEVQRERDGLIPGAIFHPRNGGFRAWAAAGRQHRGEIEPLRSEGRETAARADDVVNSAHATAVERSGSTTARY
jgi:hypothetical protein